MEFLKQAINDLSGELMNTTESFYQKMYKNGALDADFSKTLLLQGIAVFLMNTLMNFSKEHAKQNLELFSRYTEELINNFL